MLQLLAAQPLLQDSHSATQAMVLSNSDSVMSLLGCKMAYNRPFPDRHNTNTFVGFRKEVHEAPN